MRGGRRSAVGRNRCLHVCIAGVILLMLNVIFRVELPVVIRRARRGGRGAGPVRLRAEHFAVLRVQGESANTQTSFKQHTQLE